MAEMNYIPIFLGLVITTVIIAFVYWFFRSYSQYYPKPLYKEEARERSLEVLGDPSWPAEFHPIIEMARSRFPSSKYHIWGQYIHQGNGYGIFVTDGNKKSMFQVKSKIKIDNRDVDNDIRKAFDMKKAIAEAFDAIEKALKDPGGAVAARSR